MRIQKITYSDYGVSKDIDKGLAQKWSNEKVTGIAKWIWIRISSGYEDSGDNEGDTEMIQAGIERWHRDYK